jgi:predicted nucleotidyltransferase component of viral defense system
MRRHTDSALTRTSDLFNRERGRRRAAAETSVTRARGVVCPEEVAIMAQQTKRSYETPKLTIYSRQEILATLGPARAIYGGIGGAP